MPITINTSRADSQHSFSVPGVLSFIVAFVISVHSWADSPAASQLDVRVLIDVSGSMKQNDPRNLRRSALNLLIESIPDGNRAGVWTFGRQVNLLTPHTLVDDAWREQFAQRQKFINSVAQRTNIGGALEEALYDADASQFPASVELDRNVILLTDGVVDIDKDPALNDTERQRVLDEVLSQYREAGATIHTIALSTLADVELLEVLAEETGGTFVVADEAENLAEVFLSALESSAPSNQVPLRDNKFVIDGSVQEFSVVVFRNEQAKPTMLIDPNGVQFTESDIVSGVKWVASEAYDLITVESPAEGGWQIGADADPNNRVTVVSNLSIDVDTLTPQLYSEEQSPLVVKLSQNDTTVIDNRFLNLVSVYAEVEGIDDSNFAIPVYREELLHDLSNPGSFEAILLHPQTPGQYQVTIRVDGKTFQRQKRFEVSVSPSFGVDLIEADGIVSIIATANNSRWLGGDVRLQTNVNDALGEMLGTVSLSRVSDKQWQGQYSLLSSGAHTFSMTAYRANQKLPLKPVVLEGEPLFVPVTIEPTEVESAAANDDQLPVLEFDEVNEPVEAEAPAGEIPEEPVAADLAEQEDEGGLLDNWILIVALAIGNFALIGGLYFVYRKLLADPAGETTDDSADVSVDELVEELEADVKQEAETSQSNIAAEPEPMPEIVVEEQALGEVSTQPEDLPDESSVEKPDQAEPAPDALTEDIDGLLEELNESLDAELMAADAESKKTTTDDPVVESDEGSDANKAAPDDEMDFDIEFDLSSDISEELQQNQK